jgi:hypothetical protein
LNFEKFQAPNSKSQTNLKFQYSMTKTDGLRQEMRLSLTQRQFGILDLGHCDLFVIWDLLFGI